MVPRINALTISALAGLFFATNLQAQDASVPDSRTGQIESEQSAKSQALTPDTPDRSERRFVDGEQDARYILQGPKLHLQMGGLPMPATFAVGPAVQWQSRNDAAHVDLWAVGSFSGFYGAGTGLELPRFTSRRLDVTFKAAHYDLPRMDFYGEGPTSVKGHRTDYRLEKTPIEAGVEWSALTHLQPHCKAEEDLLNVGPGTSDTVTSTPLRFGPAQAPGIDLQSNYFIGGCGLKFDFRDLPEYPRSGTALFLDYRRFVAEQRSINSFHRANGSVEQYIPFFNAKRVIVLHAAADMTFHDSNQVVPFYMQPTLGGYSDLRGYRALRYYDENAVVANAEYRWEVCTGFDMALFMDAGEVFHRPSQFSLGLIQNDAGFGLRFNNQQNLVWRIDTGFSREGFQIWASFKKVF